MQNICITADSPRQQSLDVVVVFTPPPPRTCTPSPSLHSVTIKLSLGSLWARDEYYMRLTDILFSCKVFEEDIMILEISAENVLLLQIFNSSSRWLQIIFVLNPALP